MSRFVIALVTVCAVVIALWALGEAAGLDLALVPALATTLLLTAILHLVFSRRRRRS